MHDFKVGDEIKFTRECPNEDYWDFPGTILSINLFNIKIELERHPTNFNLIYPLPWIETLETNELSKIRKLTKLDKALK